MIIVQKYGGSSVATVEKIQAVAEKVVAEKQRGNDVVVVLSAMGKTTDALLNLVRQVDESPSRRELDLLLSTGECVSTSLLCMALQKMGHDAIALTGPQAQIITDSTHNNARIIEVRPFRILDELQDGKIVVVTGFQGISYTGELTTLGRGGSDTSAVALAAALGAEHCDIYSDVDGVYSADPRVVPAAVKLDELDFEEMQEYARNGARVLNAQAVEFARKQNIAIYARSAFKLGDGTLIHRVDGAHDDPLRQIAAYGVAGVTGLRDLMIISYEPLSESDSTGYEVLDELRECEIVAGGLEVSSSNVGVIVTTENIADAEAFAENLHRKFPARLTAQTGVGSVSAVGLGVGAKPGALIDAQRALQDANIETLTTFVTRESVTCVVNVDDVDEAQRILHRTFIEAPVADAEGTPVESFALAGRV